MSRVYLASPYRHQSSGYRSRLLPVSHAYWPGGCSACPCVSIFRITTDTGTAQGKVRQQERVDIAALTPRAFF